MISADVKQKIKEIVALSFNFYKNNLQNLIKYNANQVCIFQFFIKSLLFHPA